MQRSLFTSTGLGILAVLGFMVAAWAQTAPSQADLGKLIIEEAAAIKSTLAKPKVEKKAESKVRLAALLIAHYAQSSIGKDPAKAGSFATLRDKALAVLKAVDDGKLDDARKLAASLSPDIAADAGAKVAPVALETKLDFEYVMKVFTSKRMGGFGLESDLEELLALKGPVEPAEAQKIQTNAQRLAMVALLSQSYAPAKDEGKKTRKLWTDLSKEMYTSALALAEAAKTKQGATISKAAENLSVEKAASVCARCHEVFR